MLLVGLIDGGVELVEVMRSTVNLPHELHTTKIEESARGKHAHFEREPLYGDAPVI